MTQSTAAVTLRDAGRAWRVAYRSRPPSWTVLDVRSSKWANFKNRASCVAFWLTLQASEDGDAVRAPYAMALYCDKEGATLNNLREAVTTLEETERTARRVLGGAHPSTNGIEAALREARAALAAHESLCCRLLSA